MSWPQSLVSPTVKPSQTWLWGVLFRGYNALYLMKVIRRARGTYIRFISASSCFLAWFYFGLKKGDVFLRKSVDFHRAVRGQNFKCFKYFSFVCCYFIWFRQMPAVSMVTASRSSLLLRFYLLSAYHLRKHCRVHISLGQEKAGSQNNK